MVHIIGRITHHKSIKMVRRSALQNRYLHTTNNDRGKTLQRRADSALTPDTARADQLQEVKILTVARYLLYCEMQTPDGIYPSTRVLWSSLVNLPFLIGFWTQNSDKIFPTWEMRLHMIWQWFSLSELCGWVSDNSYENRGVCGRVTAFDAGLLDKLL